MSEITEREIGMSPALGAPYRTGGFVEGTPECATHSPARIADDFQAALDDREHPYHSLAQVLLEAYSQAAFGKGKARHANELPFTEQPMLQIGRRRGIGFILGQSDKKSEEAQGMLERGEVQAFHQEILGSIVYLSGALVFTRGRS